MKRIKVGRRMEFLKEDIYRLRCESFYEQKIDGEYAYQGWRVVVQVGSPLDPLEYVFNYGDNYNGAVKFYKRIAKNLTFH